MEPPSVGPRSSTSSTSSSSTLLRAAVKVTVALLVVVLMSQPYTFEAAPKRIRQNASETATPVRRQPRTAVCVSGQLRTFTMPSNDPHYPSSWSPMIVHGVLSKGTVLDALQNRTVAQTIVDNLFPALGEYDVFMSIGTRGGQHEPIAGDSSVCEPLRPRGPLGGILHCDVYDEEDLPVYGGFWVHYAFPREQYRQQFLQQLYGMYRCRDSILRQQQLRGVPYDFVVRVRPDTAVYAPVAPLEELDFGTPDEPHVLIADPDACCCGHEDWFGIGPFPVMDQYLERFASLQALRNPVLVNGWSAEQFLADHILKKSNAMLVPEPKLPVCIVKPTRRRDSGEP
jgi:hypothetical protein